MRRHLTYANVVASLALFIALGGGAYAALTPPKNSVTTLQVKNGSLLAKDFKRGQLKAGRRGAQGLPGAAGAAGDIRIAELGVTGTNFGNVHLTTTGYPQASAHGFYIEIN